MFEGSLNLEGRVALVTGGGRGIGRAVVKRFAEAGAHVVVNYLKDERTARETADYAAARGVRAVCARADVRSPAEAENLARLAVESFGRIDVLVCNAGIWEGAAVEEIDETLWNRVLDINLKGTWTVCRACVPYMKRARAGRIVIVSSTAGQRGEAFYSNYAASKGGQISFAKSLAVELAPFNINVNAIAPGWVETDLNEEVFAEADFRERVARGIPLGKIASADEIALPILFLASDWARHITGEVLNVNGGSVLCG
jgi:3-oxoacyl-[acyl-carrier protein] reductase